jgi:hypothetical protein|nr:MAG TPA_asm: virion morphogenesis protein [Caudoviricetes sp.]
MIKTVVSVKRTAGTPLNDSLKELKKTSIYVGIPRGSDGDVRDDGSGILNSDLGWIHEKGSPAAGIPPRPFLEPGVESVKDVLAECMGDAITAALKGDNLRMNANLEEASQRALSAVQNYMNTADFEPLKPATLKYRNRSRGTKSKRDGEDEGTAENRPLINTRSLIGALLAMIHKD